MKYGVWNIFIVLVEPYPTTGAPGHLLSSVWWKSTGTVHLDLGCRTAAQSAYEWMLYCQSASRTRLGNKSVRGLSWAESLPSRAVMTYNYPYGRFIASPSVRTKAMQCPLRAESLPLWAQLSWCRHTRVWVYRYEGRHFVQAHCAFHRLRNNL